MVQVCGSGTTATRSGRFPDSEVKDTSTSSADESNDGHSPNVLHISRVQDATQEDIDKILPLLIWPDRKFRVLRETAYGHSTIYDIGHGRLVKTGPAVSPEEANAMIFVRAHTSIPVPEVYMVFEHQGETHIVMERIEGIDLRRAQYLDANGEYSPDGGMVTPDGLQAIVKHLSQIVEELRDLGRRLFPGVQCYGSWPDGPFRNCYFTTDPPTTPFKSTREFHEYFLKELGNKYSDTPTYFAVKDLCHASEQPAMPTLTHGDLAPRNMIIRDNRIAAIVDWETFGWYPEFWEAMALRNSSMSSQLHDAVEKVFGRPSMAARTYRDVYGYLSNPF